MHFEVTESTSKLDHILNEVRQRWGDNYVVVTVDGLEL